MGVKWYERVIRCDMFFKRRGQFDVSFEGVSDDGVIEYVFVFLDI